MAKTAVISLAKSGTHLISRALELMGLQLNFHLGAGNLMGWKNLITSRVKYLGQPSVIIGLDLDVCVGYKSLRQALQRVKDNQYITLHAGYSCALDYLLDEFGFNKIAMIRDPRAVLVSYIHYVRELPSHFLYRRFASLSFDECVAFTLKGGEIAYGNTHIYINPFFEKLFRIDRWRAKPGALWIRFEELVGAQGGGGELSQDRMLKDIAVLLEKQDGSHNLSSIKSGLYGGTATFRKGKVNAWREEISKPLLDQCNQDLREVILAWGYEI